MNNIKSRQKNKKLTLQIDTDGFAYPVIDLWKPLFSDGVHIDFAHRTFIWDSEASMKAHVHCVIVGFSFAIHSKPRELYIDGRVQYTTNINAYLVAAENVFIENRKTPICDVPAMLFGNMPNDGGNLIVSPEEVALFDRKFIRQYIGAEEFINNKLRYCLWLQDVPPSEYRHNSTIMERIEKIRSIRSASNREGTRKLADTPMLFGEIRQPENDYILVPRVSSENRRYVPMGFMPPEVIASDATLVIPFATLYHFGVLTSNVHMAWMRVVCGRLKSDYRYSKDIVYNNFPWPTPTDAQKRLIEKTAHAILDARAKYADSTLADLYGEQMYLYPLLLEAHRENDRAVMQVYGFSVKDMTESACVAELMKLYQARVEELSGNKGKGRG